MSEILIWEKLNEIDEKLTLLISALSDEEETEQKGINIEKQETNL